MKKCSIIPFLLTAVAAGPIVTPAWQNHMDLFTTPSACNSSQELMSCSFGNSSNVDTCCVENPGGVVLFTQLWNSDVVNSPTHQWTMHGSWPDNCDGTYGSFCNFENTEVDSVEEVLKSKGEYELISYMNNFWLNDNGTNDAFWSHEFNKHATCMSTIRPSCYDNYTEGQNVVDFVKMSIRQYHELPTFTWLADAGIVPSYSQTYKAEDIQAALDKAFGYKVFVGCTNGTILDEVWYYHQAQGSLLRQNFVKIDTTYASTCKGDVQYLPKQGKSFVLW
ncbi:hypothetical protein DASC09_026010 [Saccharomycopsis crataegensis]|uniref:ribonuclease T2 n=1 Tax=Saccharomycopsis crataegensis TaxID=43959 RepID=A0AAV5QKS3_9ASCO|nr:hypothetical protein DASC09_026010 [Saccharomycopsis crataegensis]